MLLTIVFGISLQAQTNEKISVQINQQKTLPKSKLKIKFVSLIEDSRCPKGTQCIQAGNARIRFIVSKDGKSDMPELGTNLNPRAIVFAGYEIKLIGLTPYPANNIRIDRNGYVAAFSISKAKKPLVTDK